MKRKKMMSRRGFLKTAAFLAGGLALSLSAAGTAAEKAMLTAADAGKTLLEYMKDRIAAVYTRDRQMPVRSSGDNPEIKAIYADFLGSPMGPYAERYLHRALTDRSFRLAKMKKKGLYPYKRLGSFPAGYPFETGK